MTNCVPAEKKDMVFHTPQTADFVSFLKASTDDYNLEVWLLTSCVSILLTAMLLGGGDHDAGTGTSS